MDIMSFISPNFLLIECQLVPSTGLTQSKNVFGQQQQLQNRKVIAIEAYNQQDMLYSPVSSTNLVVPPAVFQDCALTMYRSASKHQGPEGNYYDQIPLSRLRPVTAPVINGGAVGNSNAYSVFRMRPAEISWTKSYVTVPQNVALSAAVSCIFGVHYLDENVSNDPKLLAQYGG